VLRDAVQATVRQKISRRMIVAVSASAIVLGIGIFIVRMAATSGEALSGAAVPASATAVESSTAPSAVRPAAAGSVGEGLYRGTDPAESQPAASQGL
jgi:guanyl-specific ribonuclease Sa